MEIERIAENHEILHDVPIELCLDNAFEVEESDGAVDCEGDESDVGSYIGDARIGHPFNARRTEGGKYEILGANDVLASARRQGIKKLGTVCLASVADEKWLLMSWYTRGVDVRRGYHMWKINKTVGSLTDQQFVTKHEGGAVHREWVCERLDFMIGINMGKYPIDDAFLKQISRGTKKDPNTSCLTSWKLAQKVLEDICERWIKLKEEAQ
jgi:hypothetical protein